MKVLDYEFSDRFESFFEDQVDSFGLEIVFLLMSEHPRQSQFGKAHGTTMLSDDGSTLKVFLNPDCFEKYPDDIRDSVAETIAVHEILHQWTKAQGFPEVQGADIYAELAEWFTNLFHHRVINAEMDRLGFDYSVQDRKVAKDFLDWLRSEAPSGQVRTLEGDRKQLFAIVLAEMRNRFTRDEYEVVVPYFAYSNTEVFNTAQKCADAIDESRCWKDPMVMFEVMYVVRKSLCLEANILDFKNPETGEWTEDSSQ